jgi:hypothetical protein
VLHLVLTAVLAKRKSSGVSPPEHLWVQADNASGENKNHTVLAYCAWLVSRGVFKTVQVNHLLVGHTHEDIDAFFAILSMALKRG